MRRRKLIPLIGGKTSAARPFAEREGRSITTDVGAWLRNLGLEQYETAFRKNAIDEMLLPSLTAEDLKDLGVSVVTAVSCSTLSVPCTLKRRHSMAQR
jgi:hypothetical protein